MFLNSSGYHIKLESKKSAKTRILLMTTGVLLRRLQARYTPHHTTPIDTDMLLRFIVLKCCVKFCTILYCIKLYCIVQCYALSYFDEFLVQIYPDKNDFQ